MDFSSYAVTSWSQVGCLSSRQEELAFSRKQKPLGGLAVLSLPALGQWLSGPHTLTERSDINAGENRFHDLLIRPVAIYLLVQPLR